MSASASHLVVLPEDVISIAETGRPARRRMTLEQGRALEVLAHAVEYLVDTRLHCGEEREGEAVELLKRANRQVFLGCRVVEPLVKRVLRWIH